MTAKEFHNYIVQELTDHKIPNRRFCQKKDGADFYTQDFSAINMVLNAEMYDINGSQIWITFPIPDMPDWKIQINIRTWFNAEFRDYTKDIDSFSVSILFLHEWSAIGYYTFVDRDKKLKEVHKNIQYIKKVPLPHSKNHHYCPDDNFYQDYVYEWILLAKNCIEILTQQNLLQKYSNATTENVRKQIYSKEIKPIIKTHFDEYFSIR